MAKRILIVEDEPEIRTVLAIAVERDGEFKAMVARDGTEGLRVAEAECPDVILLDVLMPGVDGYEVCRQIKANPKLRDVPVVFLSAQADYRALEKGRRVGACATLCKPFDPMELSRRILSIMKEAGTK